MVISFYHGKHCHPHYLTRKTANQLPILTHCLRRHQLMHGSCRNHKCKFNHIPFLPKGKEKKRKQKKVSKGTALRDMCWSRKHPYMQNGCGDREPKFLRNDSESYNNVSHFTHISHCTISATHTHTHCSGFVDVYKINSTFSHRINTAQNFVILCTHSVIKQISLLECVAMTYCPEDGGSSFRSPVPNYQSTVAIPTDSTVSNHPFTYTLISLL